MKNLRERKNDCEQEEEKDMLRERERERESYEGIEQEDCDQH